MVFFLFSNALSLTQLYGYLFLLFLRLNLRLKTTANNKIVAKTFGQKIISEYSCYRFRAHFLSVIEFCCCVKTKN